MPDDYFLACFLTMRLPRDTTQTKRLAGDILRLVGGYDANGGRVGGGYDTTGAGYMTHGFVGDTTRPVGDRTHGFVGDTTRLAGDTT